MPDSCGSVQAGEILNAEHADWPLLEITLYGNRTEVAKLGKRLKCGLRSVPARLKVHKELDPLIAAEKGLATLPAIMVGDTVISEGWIQTEELAEKLLHWIHANTTEGSTGAQGPKPPIETCSTAIC